MVIYVKGAIVSGAEEVTPQIEVLISKMQLASEKDEKMKGRKRRKRRRKTEKTETKR